MCSVAPSLIREVGPDDFQVVISNLSHFVVLWSGVCDRGLRKAYGTAMQLSYNLGYTKHHICRFSSKTLFCTTQAQEICAERWQRRHVPCYREFEVQLHLFILVSVLATNKWILYTQK